jgi:hypothetical protein
VIEFQAATSLTLTVKGCTFGSKGGIASKGTGGGLVSATTHGVAKFVAPGSMNVKAEGKNIHLMGEATTNNNSNPANAATIAELQAAGSMGQIEDALEKIAEECNNSVNEEYNKEKTNPEGTKPSGPDCTALGTKKHKCCEDAIKKAKNPRVHSEVPYDKAGKLMDSKAIDALKAVATAAWLAAGKAKGSWAAAFFGGGNAPKIKADVVITRPGAASASKGNISKVIDFKFNCGDKGKMSKDQKDKYKTILGKTPEIIHKSW